MLRSTRARVSAAVIAATLAVVGSLMAFSSQAGATGATVVAGKAAIGGTCTGEIQGLIKSDGSVVGHSGWWSISRLTDGVTTPADVATGQVTGRHQEQGVAITMTVNPATIGLVSAQANNEVLRSCQFTFYRANPRGPSQAYLQIKLTNALVVGYSLTGTPASASSRFTFVAQKIQRTWIVGNKTAVDNWSVPVS